jgi:hypothetical protein
VSFGASRRLMASVVRSPLGADYRGYRGRVEVSQPEKCIDCENRLGGEDHGRHWHLCKFCGEAVCDSCGVTHYCEKQRSMKPNNLR